MSKTDRAALAKGADAIHRAERELPESKAGKLDGTIASVEKEITRLHNEILTAARMSLQKAITIGKLLYRVRASRKGHWMSWLEQKAPFSHDTAMRYMRCFQNRAEIKFRNVRNLSDAYELICSSKRNKPSDNEAANVVIMPGADSQPAGMVILNKVAALQAQMEASIDADVEADATADVDPMPVLTGMKRRKSRKQIEKELQRISEQEQEDERQVDSQLDVFIEKLSRKVRAQWLEFPDKLAAHGKALVELSERLRLNTPTQ